MGNYLGFYEISLESLYGAVVWVSLTLPSDLSPFARFSPNPGPQTLDPIDPQL